MSLMNITMTLKAARVLVNALDTLEANYGDLTPEEDKIRYQLLLTIEQTKQAED